MARRGALAEARSLLLLAAPLILAQLAQNGMSVIDTLMVGRLGPEALAGIALGSTVFSFVLLLLMAVLFAVAPHVAQAHGARDRQGAARAVRQGLWLALGLSVPGCAVLLLGRTLLAATGQEPALAASAGSYLRALAPGLPFALALTAMRGFLEGHGDTRPIMLVAALGMGLNVAANDALMYGHWGLPRLGLVGCGVATAFVFAVMATAVAFYIAWRYPHYRVFRHATRPDPGILATLVAVGWPISLSMAFEVGLFALASLLMGRFGEAALAGHQIAFQSASTTFMVPLGIGMATGIRVGQAAGRGEAAAVGDAGRVGIALSVAFMAVSGLVFGLAPDAVIGLFLRVADPDHREVVGFARLFLRMAALFQVFDGAQVAASSALRGLRDTRVPMVLTLVAYWLVGAPAAIGLAFGAGLGPRGLWLGLVLGLAAAAVMLIVRFVRRPGRGALAPSGALR